MTPDLHSDQTILENAQAAYLGTAIESFLVDRKASGISVHSVKFYQQNIQPFHTYCNDNGVNLVQDITPDLLRRYFLKLSETHNPGGVHGHYRAMRALFRWLNDEEIMPPTWRNPILKIKPPQVNLEPLEPVSLEDVRALIAACKGQGFYDRRDRAILLVLLDTGLRASELCGLNVEDVEFATGQVMVRHGKGDKDRYVFLSSATQGALRSYLRERGMLDSPALFVSTSRQRLTYHGLRQILRRRMKRAGLEKSGEATLHSFRRAFCITMYRNGVDLLALQRLMGHSDLQALRRYLNLTPEELRKAHERYSPVEGHQWT